MPRPQARRRGTRSPASSRLQQPFGLAQVIERIDVGGTTRVRAVDLDDIVLVHQRAGAFVTVESPRLRPHRPPQEHGIAPLPVVRRHRQTCAVPVGAGEPAVGVRADQRLVGEADRDRAHLRPWLQRLHGRPQRSRDAAPPPGRAHDHDALRGGSSDGVAMVADDEHDRTQGAHGRGTQRPRDQRSAAQLDEGLGDVATQARPAAGGEDRDRDVRLGQADAASSARRTSTRARCSRYSGAALMSPDGSVPSAACSAASAIDAPPATASSTATARSGVVPMFTSATRVSSFRTAMAPTIAQSWARRWNFWYENPAPGDFGTRISVSNSSGSSAVSRKPRKNAAAATVRSPPGPWTKNVASSARSRAGRSDAGSPWETDPPIVPRCRTWLSPTSAATVRNGAHCAESTSLISRSRCRVSAPTATWSPASRT